MSFKHFCHICNVKFHRAVDFVLHNHEEIKTISEAFIGEENGRREKV